MHHYITLLQFYCNLCLGETEVQQLLWLCHVKRQKTTQSWTPSALYLAEKQSYNRVLRMKITPIPLRSYAYVTLEWLAVSKQIASTPAEISTHFEPLIMLEQLLKTQKSVSDCIAKLGMGKTNIVVTFISNLIVIMETVLCTFSSLGKSVLIMKTYLIIRCSRNWPLVAGTYIFYIYFKFKQIFNFWCYLSISILCYIEEVFNRRTLM